MNTVCNTPSLPGAGIGLRGRLNAHRDERLTNLIAFAK